MIIISQKIKDFLDTQNLGYVATVSPEQKPNVSPKGTIMYWDSRTLIFADICSPDTIRNIQNNPNVEINVIDPILRKGYLFAGLAKLLDNSTLTTKEIIKTYAKRGLTSSIRAVVMVDVLNVTEVLSPLYHMGVTEQEIKSKSKKRFNDMYWKS